MPIRSPTDVLKSGTFKDAPRVDVPKPGLYRYRVARVAPWQAVCITYGPAIDPVTGETLDRSPIYAAIVNGEPTSVDDVWPSCSGEPISDDEYNFILAQHQWAVRHAPHEPEAKPREWVDLGTLPPIF